MKTMEQVTFNSEHISSIIHETTNIREGDKVNILASDDEIVIRRITPVCEFCKSRNVVDDMKFNICLNCAEIIIERGKELGYV